MSFQRTLLACAVLSAYPLSSSAQQAAPAVPTVVVTASPIGGGETEQILVPAKVLAGDELRDKLGNSIGETLSNELGVSASGFGAGSSRPIIRGLEGPRVKMLENGMAVADVSSLSNDHAVSAEGSTARQIEILRGPAALLYGSGAIGGLVNIVNERIPTALEESPHGQYEVRTGSVDRLRAVSASVDGAVGQVGLHADGNWRRTGDYRIPGARELGETGPSMRLPNSATHERSGGAGLSYVGERGHVGASIGRLENRYGVPSEEGSVIDLAQTRYDIDALLKAPLAGFDTFKFKLGHTDYRHDELDAEGSPETRFANRALETRWELAHRAVAGWRGTLGMQTENTHFSSLGADPDAPDTVPATRSTSYAAFLVEERDLGPVRVNAGVRVEAVKRTPVGYRERTFDLTSYSAGGLWTFMPGYGFGTTLSVAQRAPSTEELYSGGPHHSTETFDIGNPDFVKETSRNLEVTLQKTSGLLRWRANLFRNKVRNFVYGQLTGRHYDEEGLAAEDGELAERVFAQADATIRGAEAELGYNRSGNGWSGRLFADTTRGRLAGGGNLPLQPATRMGLDAGYRDARWRAGVSVVRAFEQDRLAETESVATPAYTQVNATLSYTQRLGRTDLTWFVQGRNLLNEDIRLSTSLLRAVSPMPGRNFLAGVRAKF